ncbi:MAG: helix-turn-helix transcriptional regulator [Eisenbergiella porci]|uniref:Helix-turn-helix transcriptional regulator n=1 Tax=Eisenbergiella porci TaxID=2652274 RepID=A0A6N7WGR5_9FIRM|nr:MULTISPECIES: helix-turn-helix transcriptional regulator [Eisenbergiella]MDY2652191.1 helix-turn-helix transcriptional regulator [Eisenbergiella porci]MSS88864.1 helix-turn-helix transcriptional regulator [Eisenbergiella porci]
MQLRLTLLDNIRSCRKTMGFTQEQLAEAMNVTVGAVSKWESGATTPELSVLLELAALFEVSVDALLGYHVLDSQSEQAVESIRDLMQGKKYDQAVHEAKKRC